ncbi:MAG: sn-glycerol-3-phosphate ABC transporter ATP-binding protein UgpC [Clostridia bacterium]|nr:sn-glycerol-3-phosphate ABC transporter ATP-binding protein UgpC [Clostridia bacterium]
MGEIVFGNVSKEFRDEKRGFVLAVNDASFTIRDKEFVAIVGPSGCGKTTSLRMIAGLERQTSGNIYIDGRLVNDLHPKDRDIAMVFQDYALYPHMTVYENMSFGLKNLRFPKAEIDQKVQEAARMMGIEELLDRKPRELSGGQRQRVAVGRSIVRQPKVFLFDEPLSNLDAKLRIQMRVELAELHKRLQTTIVYVTHDQVEAMTLGQRIIVMDQGVIQQIAPPDELYQHPRNLFVAGFIGAPTINTTTVAYDGEKIVSPDLTAEVPEAIRARLGGFVGCDVILGVRSEDIHDAQISLVQGCEARLAARVKVVEYLGAQKLAYFQLNGKTFTAQLPAASKVESSAPWTFVVDLGKAQLFNPEDGRALLHD